MGPSKHVREQVDRIIDEGNGKVRTVIVQLTTTDTDPDRDRMLKAAAQASIARSMAVSPRDVLPAEAIKHTRGASRTLSRAQRIALQDADSSFAAQFLLHGGGSSPAARPLDRGVMDALQSWVEDHPGSASMKRGRKDSTADSPTLLLGAARAVVVEVDKDRLARLPTEVAGIRNVYPNRRVDRPRTTSADGGPENTLGIDGSTWGLQSIGAPATWGAFGGRGEGVVVGLLDTGVDAEHPILKDKVAGWAEFDGRGRKVETSAQPRDSDEHGTHCAGTIVGGAAEGRWLGVAPSAKLAAALVLDGEEGGTDAQVLAGMQWAIDQRVDVISMSLGGLNLGPDVPDTYTETIVEALRLGIPIVTAIGNSGSQTTGSPGNDFFAFSVGATDHADRVAGFSGGRTMLLTTSNYIDPKSLPMPYSKPEVSAPGVAVLSAAPNGKYQWLSGTSMATPHVAGAIALLLSNTTIKQQFSGPERAYLLMDLLTGSVEALGEAGRDHRYGFGRIDVFRAVGTARRLGYGGGT